jgi:hypothetical protein
MLIVSSGIDRPGMLESVPLVAAAVAPERIVEALRVRGRALRARTTLERDYWGFRRRYGSILRHVPPSGQGTALLASLTYSVFQLKLEGMLTKAFQAKGLEPVAAVPADADLPRRYLELFGVRRFVAIEDYLTSADESRAREAAASALAEISAAADLKALTFEGASVGRQALSTASRALHDGDVDLGDPARRGLVERFLVLAMRTTLASRALLDELSPDVVLFNERNYAGEGPLSDVALERALNVVQFVSGFEDDSLVFKRYTSETKGLHPRSISDESWPRVGAMDWTPELDAELDREFAHRYDGTTFLSRWNQAWARPASREEIVRQLGLDPGRKTAVVFSHILWDANMFYGRDLFADQEEWFVETVRAACENDRVNWVVKLHPANVWKLRRDGYEGELDEYIAIREHIGELPAHVRLLPPDTDISTWSLFPLTDYGVTIRGSTGFELPCFGKPALTAGTGFYSGRGFTVDSGSRDEYLDRLRRIDELPPLSSEQVTLARKHAYALFRLRQTRFTTFRSVYRSVDEIDANSPFEATIEVNARSPHELETADDLRRFGDWAVDSRALDYLEL